MSDIGSSSSLCLGTILNSKVANKEYKKAKKTQYWIDGTKDTCLQ